MKSSIRLVRQRMGQPIAPWGWDTHLETFDFLYSTPVSETLELLGKKQFRAMLQEPPIPGDSGARARGYALPAYVAYQGDGDVTAGLV